jgi:hypothetical protein
MRNVNTQRMYLLQLYILILNIRFHYSLSLLRKLKKFTDRSGQIIGMSGLSVSDVRKTPAYLNPTVPLN